MKIWNQIVIVNVCILAGLFTSTSKARRYSLCLQQE